MAFVPHLVHSVPAVEKDDFIKVTCRQTQGSVGLVVRLPKIIDWIRKVTNLH